MVAIDVAAAKATEDPRLGKARMKERIAASHTVRMGERNLASTLWKNGCCFHVRLGAGPRGKSEERGRLTMPPSRANANIMRLLLVMLKSPQCQTHTIISVNMTMAPSSPAISTKICKTGCAYGDASVASKSWIENRKAMRTKKPKIALKPTLLMTPIGALQLALLVSSDKCAEASKPFERCQFLQDSSDN
jgi:hypothetical protein